MSHAGMAWGLRHHKDICFLTRFKMKIINFRLFFELSSDLRSYLWFPASAKTVVLSLKSFASGFLEIATFGDPPASGFFSESPPES